MPTTCREALEQAGFELSVGRIHGWIGMSSGLFVNAFFRETGRRLKQEEVVRLQRLLSRDAPALARRSRLRG